MPRNGDQDTLVVVERVAWTRWLSAALLLLVGIALIIGSGAWRGIEATLTSRTVHVLTGETTIAVSGRHMLILYKGASVSSIFNLTSECTEAYLLAALLIGSAPLMLLRQLAPWRTATAVAVAASILMGVNVARLAAIGVTVSIVGLDPGLQIAHTYLGSFLTFAGAAVAGIVLAAVLVSRRKAHPRGVG